MKKQTKVLVAAAMLTLGASFSSMAAMKNGTWIPEDGTWQYADRNGDLVYETWCVDGAAEYYIDEDGYLAQSRWVEEGDHMYYVLSDGAKLKNDWKLLYAYGEEEDGEIEDTSWFYFDSKGRMVRNDKKLINGKYYTFGDDGKMLTGWVNTADFTTVDGEDVAPADVEDMVYCNADGDVATSQWLDVLPWYKSTDAFYEDIDSECEDYYVGAKGGVTVGKSGSIDGFTYFFDNRAQMLTGWVRPAEAKYGDQGDLFLDGSYTEAEFIWKDADVYYACAKGYAHQNEWRELSTPDGEADGTYWYWFDSTGKVYTASDEKGSATIWTDDTKYQYATLLDGEDYRTEWDGGALTGLKLKSVFDYTAVDGTNLSASDIEHINLRNVKGELFYFTGQGRMLDGLMVVSESDDSNQRIMYLDGGRRFTGTIDLTDANENEYEFAFAPEGGDGYEKFIGINGQYKGRLYENGQLVTAWDDDVYHFEVITMDDGENYGFIVDEKGKLVTRDGEYLMDYEGGKMKVSLFKDSKFGAYRYSINPDPVYDVMPIAE